MKGDIQALAHSVCVLTVLLCGADPLLIQRIPVLHKNSSHVVAFKQHTITMRLTLGFTLVFLTLFDCFFDSYTAASPVWLTFSHHKASTGVLQCFHCQLFSPRLFSSNAATELSTPPDMAHTTCFIKAMFSYYCSLALNTFSLTKLEYFTQLLHRSRHVYGPLSNNVRLETHFMPEPLSCRGGRRKSCNTKLQGAE